MSAYPEHEKLAVVQERSQACGEFLDWLVNERRLVVAEYGEYGLVAFCGGTQKLLAEFFEIDERRLEEEKRAMLEEIRR